MNNNPKTFDNSDLAREHEKSLNVKGHEPFCPLIVGKCRSSCICYVNSKLSVNVGVGVTVYDSYCSHSMCAPWRD